MRACHVVTATSQMFQAYSNWHFLENRKKELQLEISVLGKRMILTMIIIFWSFEFYSDFS
jgi:hypothetical protein